MKNSLVKGRIRLIIYACIVGGFALAGLILFTIAQYAKARYNASSVILTGAQSQLKLLEKEEKTDLVNDKIAWYTDINEEFSKITEENYTTYKKTAIPAYALTTMALISFGLCLKFEDIAKKKEEKD